MNNQALGALGAPSEDLSKAYLCRIKESTYGIVFFGVPQHAEDGFSNLSAMDAGSLIPENPFMAALRRDLTWLKDSNETFSRSRKDFAITYFTEAPSQVTSGQPQVRECFDNGLYNLADALSSSRRSAR